MPNWGSCLMIATFFSRGKPMDGLAFAPAALARNIRGRPSLPTPLATWGRQGNSYTSPCRFGHGSEAPPADAATGRPRRAAAWRELPGHDASGAHCGLPTCVHTACPAEGAPRLETVSRPKRGQPPPPAGPRRPLARSASLRWRRHAIRPRVGLPLRLAFAVDPRCASRQRGPSPAARAATSSRSSPVRSRSRRPGWRPASGVRSRT